MKKIKSTFYNFQGYGKKDPRPGCHLTKTNGGKYSPTITSHVELNMVILEEYE